jgi:catechol 2,3-dioxygenase-like lactoylglutathione lyase family enzyme
MKKPVRKKPAGKKNASTASRVAKQSRASTGAASTSGEDGDKLAFNHAMIYCVDVDKALDFYRDLLGFKLIDDFRHENKAVYARLRAPGGDGTIALHQAGPGASVASEGVRLYLEVRELDEFCRKLQQKGFYITQLPRMMPWGWRHAYLNDPDGHELSLYWAGENRMKKTVMKTAAKAAKA